MKKSVALLLTLAMAISMVACGAKTEEAPQTTETTISIKKEERTISQKQTHQYNYDADEPSLEDLFAIENEDLFDFDDNDRK